MAAARSVAAFEVTSASFVRSKLIVVPSGSTPSANSSSVISRLKEDSNVIFSARK